MRQFVRISFGMLLLTVGTVLRADDPAGEDRWAEAMERFEALDAQTPPTPGGVVFVGSSSIRGWNLDESFPEWNTLNRGFGGSQLADSVRNIDLLVLRHEPRAVVVYAGDNDIWAGKTPEEVADDFRAFEQAVHGALPETELYYIAIKPSVARWSKADPMRTANGLIEAVCKEKPRCEFINIWDSMLGDDGQPRKELLQSDGLHLTPVGYELWTKAVREAIGEKGKE